MVLDTYARNNPPNYGTARPLACDCLFFNVLIGHFRSRRRSYTLAMCSVASLFDFCEFETWLFQTWLFAMFCVLLHSVALFALLLLHSSCFSHLCAFALLERPCLGISDLHPEIPALTKFGARPSPS